METGICVNNQQIQTSLRWIFEKSELPYVIICLTDSIFLLSYGILFSLSMVWLQLTGHEALLQNVIMIKHWWKKAMIKQKKITYKLHIDMMPWFDIIVKIIWDCELIKYDRLSFNVFRGEIIKKRSSWNNHLNPVQRPAGSADLIANLMLGKYSLCWRLILNTNEIDSIFGKTVGTQKMGANLVVLTGTWISNNWVRLVFNLLVIILYKSISSK